MYWLRTCDFESTRTAHALLAVESDTSTILGKIRLFRFRRMELPPLGEQVGDFSARVEKGIGRRTARPETSRSCPASIRASAAVLCGDAGETRSPRIHPCPGPRDEETPCRRPSLAERTPDRGPSRSARRTCAGVGRCTRAGALRCFAVQPTFVCSSLLLSFRGQSAFYPAAEGRTAS